MYMTRILSSTAITKLRLTIRTRHVQTPIPPLHHHLAPDALFPSLLLSQFQQCLRVRVFSTYASVLCLSTKLARPRGASWTCRYASFDVRGGNKLKTSGGGTVHGILDGLFKDQLAVGGDRSRGHDRSHVVDRDSDVAAGVRRPVSQGLLEGV